MKQNKSIEKKFKNKGKSITHEQVMDAYMEGTSDGKIDSVNENGELMDHNGEEINEKGFHKE